MADGESPIGDAISGALAVFLVLLVSTAGVGVAAGAGTSAVTASPHTLSAADDLSCRLTLSSNLVSSPEHKALCDEIFEAQQEAGAETVRLNGEMSGLYQAVVDRQNELTAKCPQDLSIIACTTSAVAEARGAYADELARLTAERDAAQERWNALIAERNRCTQAYYAGEFYEIDPAIAALIADSDPVVGEPVPPTTPIRGEVTIVDGGPDDVPAVEPPLSFQERIGQGLVDKLAETAREYAELLEILRTDPGELLAQLGAVVGELFGENGPAVLLEILRGVVPGAEAGAIAAQLAGAIFSGDAYAIGQALGAASAELVIALVSLTGVGAVALGVKALKGSSKAAKLARRLWAVRKTTKLTGRYKVSSAPGSGKIDATPDTGSRLTTSSPIPDGTNVMYKLPSRIKPPADRHLFDRLDPNNTYVKSKNTVISRTVDIQADIEAIKRGDAVRINNDFQVNGRTYRDKGNGSLTPFGDGPGFYTLDHGEYRALRIYKKYGGNTPEAADAFQGKNGNISPVQKKNALELWRILSQE